ncbi:MAG TPA: hypothetical protein PLA08_01260 [Candidatus Cloacimonadota bacterium]|nr:hypothetical protein [Candidatus Cloacimonadota bacterium]
MSKEKNTRSKLMGIAALLILSFAHSFFLVSSQVLFKIAALAPVNGIWSLIWALISNPTVILSVFCFGCSTVCWWVILRNFDFSLAYPLASIHYLFALAYAVIVLHEPIPASRYIGVVAIMAGVMTMTLNEKKGKAE